MKTNVVVRTCGLLAGAVLGSFAMSAAGLAQELTREQVIEASRGEWTTEFVADPTGMLHQKRSLRLGQGDCLQSVQVAGTVLGSERVALRLDMDCRYVLGQQAQGAAGSFELDVQLLNKRETLLTQNLVDDANRDGKCGYTDWQVGVPKDTTNKPNCDDDGQELPFTTYTTLNVTVKPGNKSELRMGFIGLEDDETGSRPDLRPRVLDESMIYCRPENDECPTGRTVPEGDPLLGLYKVEQFLVNDANCDTPGSAATTDAYFKIFANGEVVSGVPGWNLHTCRDEQHCASVQPRLNFDMNWNLHEAVRTSFPRTYKGRGNNRSFSGGRCQVTVGDTATALNEQGVLTMETRIYTGVITAARTTEECDRLVRTWLPGPGEATCKRKQIKARRVP